MLLIKKHNYVGFILRNHFYFKLTCFAINKLFECLDDKILKFIEINSKIIISKQISYNESQCKKISESLQLIFKSHAQHILNPENNDKIKINTHLIQIITNQEIMIKTAIQFDELLFEYNDYIHPFFNEFGGYHVTWIHSQHINCVKLEENYELGTHDILPDTQKIHLYEIKLPIIDKITQLQSLITTIFNENKIDNKNITHVNHIIENICQMINKIN